MKILAQPLPACGPEVSIDLEADTPMWQVKLRLAAATGVPVEAQKVMLEGIGRMVMADKRWVDGCTAMVACWWVVAGEVDGHVAQWVVWVSRAASWPLDGCHNS